MKYLGYGSNMLVERLKARVPSAQKLTVFTLPGYELRFHKKSTDGSGKCNIVQTVAPGVVVHGVIFEINENEIPALDEAEGVGHGYRKDTMPLEIGGVTHDVLVYIAEANAIDDSRRPYRWYHDLVLSGAIQQELPADYVALIQAIVPIEDPRPDRPERLKALAVLRLARGE